MNSFFISVIVPCFNQADYLDDNLQSVFNQTHNNWECIIINDGSTDHTETVAKKWEGMDKRFIYISKQNGGLSSARNAGLKVAAGDYIQFLDADDVLAPTKFEESLRVLENQTLDKIAVTNFLMLRDKTNNTKPPYCLLNQDLLTFNNILYNWDIDFTIPIHCGLFPATKSKEIGFEESLRGKEDWIFWVRFSQQNAKMVFIDKPLAHYRINPKSMSRSDSQMKNYHLQAFLLLSKYLEQKDYNSWISFRLNHYLNKISDLTKQRQSLKSSNTYHAGLMIKKILRTLGLLKLGRKLFQYIRTFKKSNY